MHGILAIVLCRGRVRRKSQTYPRERGAIVPDDLWTKAHRRLRIRGRADGTHARNKHGALLKGFIRR